jgi:hypothetical protein
MESVELFLAYAIRVEEEAALRYGQLADAMESGGNCEVGGLFRRLSDYSRLHLADAKARAGFREIPTMGRGRPTPGTTRIGSRGDFVAKADADLNSSASFKRNS